MSNYQIPVKFQPPTMPTGPWEVNTQCAQATGLAGLLDIERRRFWWRGQWFPLTMAGAPGQGITSLPTVGGTATSASTTAGWLYTAVNVLPNPIGVNTPLSVQTWCSSSVATAADKVAVSLLGGASARQSCVIIGDTGTPANLFSVVAKTTGAGTFTKRLSNLVPVANTVYSLSYVDRIDTFPDLYINGALNNGASALDAGGPRVSPIDMVAFGSLTGAGSTQLLGRLGYCAIWDRKLSAAEFDSLYSPTTRWDLMWQKKTLYFDISPPANQDIPPSQYARPHYITLNAFSPQAQGLIAWLTAVDGAMVQAQTPSTGATTSTVVILDAVNQIVPVKTLTFQPSTVESKASDFGLVPQTYYRGNTAATPLSNVAAIPTTIDLAGQTNLTFVYWIFPQYSPFTNATYWSTWTTGTNVMTHASVTFEGSQTLPFTSDPHLRGRWQMITVSRTLAGINVWRDQELIASLSVAGTALVAAEDQALQFFIGSNTNELGGSIQAVNALWADFRVYNRAWTQKDVEYAFKPETRWDYYWKPKYKPYEDIPIVTIGGNTFFITPDGTLIPTGAITKTAGKALAGALTPAAALAKADSKPLAGAFTPAGAFTKVVGKVFAGAFTPIATIVRSVGKGLSGAWTPAGSIAKAIGKTLSAGWTPAGALARAFGKACAGAFTPAGVLAKAIAKSLSGALTPSGVVSTVKVILLAVGGAIAPAATLFRGMAKSLVGVFAPAGTEALATSTALAGQIAPSGELPKDAGKALDANLTPTGDLSVLRVFFLVISATLTLVGDLISSIHAGSPRVLSAFGRYVAFIGAIGKHQSTVESFGRHEDSIDTFGNEGEE